jgi:hypothetical protein
MNRPPFLTGCMRLFDEYGPARAKVRVIRTDRRTDDYTLGAPRAWTRPGDLKLAPVTR